MSTSEIARLKSKFEHHQKRPTFVRDASAPPPRATPAFFEHRQREIKAAQVKAAKAAKQSAARYNLTLRALALSSAKKAEGERFRHLDEAQRARELASHYNATKRALRVALSGVPKGSAVRSETKGPNMIQTRISEGNEFEPKPEPASSHTTEEEPPKVDDVEQVTIAPDHQDPAAHVVETSQAAADLEEKKETENDAEPSPALPADDHSHAFALPEVEQAIKAGDDKVINEVLVRTFLEEVDPERAKQSARLLVEYEGKEEELMESLLKEIPAGDRELTHTVSAESLMIAANEAGEVGVGFITSGQVDPHHKSWKVTIVNDPQLDAFRAKLLARGMKEEDVEHIVDESSEML